MTVSPMASRTCPKFGAAPIHSERQPDSPTVHAKKPARCSSDTWRKSRRRRSRQNVARAAGGLRHYSCERGCARDDYGKAGPSSVERLKMDLPFVNILCAQTRTRRKCRPSCQSNGHWWCGVANMHWRCGVGQHAFGGHQAPKEVREQCDGVHQCAEHRHGRLGRLRRRATCTPRSATATRSGLSGQGAADCSAQSAQAPRACRQALVYRQFGGDPTELGQGAILRCLCPFALSACGERIGTYTHTKSESREGAAGAQFGHASFCLQESAGARFKEMRCM